MPLQPHLPLQVGEHALDSQPGSAPWPGPEAQYLPRPVSPDSRAAGGRLREWLGERQTAEALGGHVVADGYADVELPDLGEVAVLLKLDRVLPSQPASRRTASLTAGSAAKAASGGGAPGVAALRYASMM